MLRIQTLVRLSLLGVCSLAQSQTATTTADSSICTFVALPPAPTSADGTFLSLDYMIFEPGSAVTIEWNTSYTSINLWLITGNFYDIPFALAANLENTGSFVYTIAPTIKYCVPYSFRAVDAAGDAVAQEEGGFFSDQFWINYNITDTPSSLPNVVGSNTQNVSDG